MNEEKQKEYAEMMGKAEDTAKILKTIANPLRLMVLCSLVEGDKNVSTLMEVTGAPQTLMSNHLAMLRKADVVDYRRDHRTLTYFLKDQRIKLLLSTLYSIYCKGEGSHE